MVPTCQGNITVTANNRKFFAIMVWGLLSRDTVEANKLLRHVQKNDTHRIAKTIIHNVSLLKHEYPPPYDHQNIFIIACNDENSMHEVSGATLEKLISLGAQCTEPSTNDHWEAIHYTALHANKEKMSAIIKHLNAKSLNSLVYCSKHIPDKYQFCPSKNIAKTFSNNALSILLKYGKRNEDWYECCKILVMAGININQTDSNGVSPLNLIQSMNDKKLNEILEEHVMKKTPEANFNNYFYNELVEMVKANEEEKFLTYDITREEADSLDGCDEFQASCTLLQLCCVKGLSSSVKYLLGKGASVNKIISKNKNSPIMIAAKEDYEDIVKLLLEQPDLVLPEDILIKLQVKYKNLKNFAKVDKYMELILDHLSKKDKKTIRAYLLYKDELNRTALHYATFYRCSENILGLLAMGAPLTKKDLFGSTPLNSIEPSLLGKFFDRCINIPESPEDINNMMYSLRYKKREFEIEIDYEALIIENEDDQVQESDFLHHIIKQKNLTHLLNHPVVSAYLALKWAKFKWTVYINLLLYFIAYVSLLFYGFKYTSIAEASNGLLLASLLLLFIREGVQIFTFREDYLKRVDNIIDLFLIGGTIYLLAAGWVQTTLFETYNMLVAFSVVFLTSTLGIFMQLGKLPAFTVKVRVLNQITVNFLKHMIFYMFPVLAFFFCFYMLSESKDELLFFQTLYDVVSMSAGDPNADYPKQFTSNPIFGHIIYVIFIILIGIILQNLLIGLAVSDLQEIRNEAELMDKIERAKYITSIERIIFRKLRQTRSKIFRSIFGKLLRMCNVFRDNRTLFIQPYNFGCVYTRENANRKEYINDENIINHLQNIFKNLNLNKENHEPYELKMLCEKLERIENLLQKHFNTNSPL